MTSPQAIGTAPIKPNPEECKAALERILASRVFEQAGRASEFLRFVVEQTLAGRGDRLKGYTIAVEVFAKPETFDAQSDPLVRVEAGRLRRRLMEYYQGDGQTDPVRIELPRGGYAPSFTYATGPERSERMPVPLPLRHRRRVARRVFAAALLAVVAFLAWDVVNRGLAPESEVPSASSASRSGPGPRLLVLPFKNMSDNASLDSFAGGITEEVILTLVAFDFLATASPGTDATSTTLADLRARYDVGYVLFGSVRLEGTQARITIRLVDSELGTQLWTAMFDEELGATGYLAAQERIARRIGATVSSPYGPVYVHEAERHAHKAVDALDPYECMLRFYTYTRAFNAVGHMESLRCMERTVAIAPNLAQAWSALAILYLHERTFGYGSGADSNEAIEHALEAARRSLDIAGAGRVAGVALAGIRLSSGEREAFERAAQRTLEITPVFPAIAAQIGYLYVIAGDWKRGLTLIEEAIPETAFVPAQYYAAYAFRYLQTGDYAQALDWALKIDAPAWFATPMTVAAAAALAGRADIAQRETARLLELDPSFAAEGRERLMAWGLDEGLRSTLLEGLRRAGLAVQ